MKKTVVAVSILAGGILVALLSIASCQPRQEEVSFRSLDVMLAGTLYMPRSAGRHAAVVFIHGSGDDSRANYGLYAELLARNGIASLVYDKRGVGASSGSWKRSPFRALADDSLAAVHFLKSHDDIDPDRIGVWGGSEGAAIAPWVASQSSGVAFVIMQAATGVSFLKQNLYQNEQVLRANADSDEEITQGLRIIELQAHYAQTGEGWQAYADAKTAARSRSWSEALGPLIAVDSWWWKWYGTKLDFNPTSVLERVCVPVFCAWGKNDRLVPVEESRIAIELALSRGGNRDVTIKVYDGADHGIHVESLQGYVPDPRYVEDLIAWIRSRTTRAR